MVSKRSFCVRTRSVSVPVSVSIGSVPGSVCRMTRQMIRHGALASTTPNTLHRDSTVHTVISASIAARTPSAVVASAPVSAASANTCGMEKWNAAT